MRCKIAVFFTASRADRLVLACRGAAGMSQSRAGVKRSGAFFTARGTAVIILCLFGARSCRREILLRCDALCERMIRKIAVFKGRRSLLSADRTAAVILRLFGAVGCQREIFRSRRLLCERVRGEIAVFGAASRADRLVLTGRRPSGVPQSRAGVERRRTLFVARRTTVIILRLFGAGGL